MEINPDQGIMLFQRQDTNALKRTKTKRQSGLAPQRRAVLESSAQTSKESEPRVEFENDNATPKHSGKRGSSVYFNGDVATFTEDK